MKALLRGMAFGAAICSAGYAFADEGAARLGGIRGPVLVSVSAGFVPASEGQQLKAGDRVMIAGEGAAVLTYGPDCSIPLAANSMTTVEESGCVTAAHDTGPDPASNDVGVQRPATTQPSGLPVGAVFAAPVVVLGGTVGLMIAFDNDDGDDDEEPVSP
jgi:hypothetical protein